MLTIGLTGRVRGYLLARNFVDHPNERSSHSQPTPRGGGWAIIFVLGLFLILPSLVLGPDLSNLSIIVGTALLIFISWRDDRKHVNAATRLAVHITAACIGSLAFSSDEMLFGGLIPLILDRLIMILGWAWFINLYNFMDGIDGITGVETISLAMGGCLVMSIAGISDLFADTLTLSLTGVCLGFLVYNWYPSKIFMGDVGSIPLGFLSGFILILLAVHGHPISAAILPLYYIADSGITIIKRGLRGEKIWQPHRQHFYQRAAMAAGRHDTIIFPIIACNVSLICMAILAVNYAWPAFIVGASAVAILLHWMHNKRP